MLKSGSRHIIFIVFLLSCIAALTLIIIKKDDWGLNQRDIMAIYPSLGTGILASAVFLIYSLKSNKSFKVLDMFLATCITAATFVLFTYVMHYDVINTDEKFEGYPENLKWIAVCIAAFFIVLVPIVLLVSNNIRNNIHFFPFEEYLDNINFWSILLSPSIIPSYIFKFIYSVKKELPNLPSFPDFNKKFQDASEIQSLKYFSYEKQNLFYFGGTLNRKIVVTIVLGLLFGLAPYIYIKNNPRTEEGIDITGLEQEKGFFESYPYFITIVLSVVTCLWLIFLFGVNPKSYAPV